MYQQSDRHPQVSVVIPTYNHAHFLGRAIVSALCQTFQDFEVIVVDDASDDDTAQVIERLHDARVRLLRLPKHKGAARARNLGIWQARGDWVAFLDSDDEWLPEKLERQMACIGGGVDPELGVLYCSYYRQDADGERVLRPKREPPQGDVLDALLTGKGIPTTSAYVVRRSALLDVGGFDEKLSSAQDVSLLLRLAQASHRSRPFPSRCLSSTTMMGSRSGRTRSPGCGGSGRSCGVGVPSCSSERGLRRIRPGTGSARAGSGSCTAATLRRSWPAVPASTLCGTRRAWSRSCRGALASRRRRSRSPCSAVVGHLAPPLLRRGQRAGRRRWARSLRETLGTGAGR